MKKNKRLFEGYRIDFTLFKKWCQNRRSYAKIKGAVLLFPLLTILFWRCAQENPVPAYIHIPAISVQTQSGQGTTNHKITDAWVFVNDMANGIYELPVTFPVIELGERTIQVAAGIRNNGIRDNPIIYPLTTPFLIKKTLKAGQVDTLKPVVTYAPNLTFGLIEDFETSNTFTVALDNTPQTAITAVPNGFEGRSGKAVLTKNFPLMEKASGIRVAIPPLSNSVFLELHYKTDAPLSVGLNAITNTTPQGTKGYKITLFPNKEWNKTYINLTSDVNTARATEYQVLFRSLLPDSLTTATILIDNVKLIFR